MALKLRGYLRFQRFAICRGATARELHQLARGKGFIALADVALRRVLDGTTTIDEISRVVDLTDRLS